jgi:hypothetical protein
MTNQESNALEGDTGGAWQTCPRCGVHIIDGTVRFAFKPTEPRSYDELAKRVCQWAHAQDRRDGTLGDVATRPSGCINPCYDMERSYGSPLDDIPPLP